MAQQKQGTQKKYVDFQADVMRPVKMGDSSALSLVGNVVFFHNGAVITCDSAIRYNDRLMDCYRNVIINKDKTYIYGEKADYNGYENLAKVYSQLVKTIDEDATLYTYNFTFNTLDNIGFYTGGGTMTQKESKMESKKGYYYSDTRKLVAVEEVEITNPDYKLKSDSVSYDLNTEVARFFVKTYIWNKQGDILSALHGEYDSKNDIYDFTKDSYILTKDKELWADSIKYFKFKEEAILHRDIQMIDDLQQATAFGDFGHYWGGERKERTLLTKRPSILNFDKSDPDTLYMKADTMYMYTDKTLPGDTIPTEAPTIESFDLPAPPADSVAVAPVDSTAVQPKIQADSLLKADLSPKELRKMEQEAKKAEKAKEKAEKEKEKAEKAKLRTQKYLERRARLQAKYGEGPAVDSAAIKKRIADSLQRVALLEQARLDSLERLKAPRDSINRITQSYRNVKMYKGDMRAVCDSLVSHSFDSTMHMYINPVVWNLENQIKSEVVDMFMKNGQIDRALFSGEPIMSSQIDTIHYNQVKGKTMEAFFRDKEIYRTDVVGNAQTYYYLEEDNPDTVFLQGFLVAECADITFDIEGRKIKRIIYRGQPVYTIYPMSMIPETQSLYLKGFVWEGHLRPSLEDVFDRVIRPSERNEHYALKQPEFVITGNINSYKQYLLISKTWRDRDDKLSVEALEFIQSLGHTIKQ